MTFRTYSDPSERFEIKVPQNWLAENLQQAGVEIAFLSPEDNVDFRSNVNVVVQHLSPLTKQEYILLNQLQIRHMLRSNSLERDQLIESGAHVFEWENQIPLPLWIHQRLFFGEDLVFTVTSTCLAGEKKQLSDTFEAISDSFRLKNQSN